MPISDGYDAIKNIHQLYDDIKIFKIEQNFNFSNY